MFERKGLKNQKNSMSPFFKDPSNGACLYLLRANTHVYSTKDGDFEIRPSDA